MKIRGLLPLFLACSNANAEGDFQGRFLTEIDCKDSTTIVMFGKRGSQLSVAGRPRLEFAAGVLDAETVRRGIVSIGPVWQRSSYLRYGVLLQEFSFAPTLLSSAKIDERDLGGIVHFTSALAIGWKPSDKSGFFVGLRIQHISNGSIHRHNPGMNSAGLEFYWTPWN